MRILGMLLAAGLAVGQSATGDFPSLTEKQARQRMADFRKNGQVGGSFDFRVTNTDRSYNYKLRATWITGEVAGAAARILMLARGYSEEKARASLLSLESSKTYILVEIDPREGSGVIPRGWTANFGPRDSSDSQVPGAVLAADSAWRDFLSAFPRDYAYDVFFIEFPVNMQGAALTSSNTEVELTVRIYDKVGKVRWRIPAR